MKEKIQNLSSTAIVIIILLIGIIIAGGVMWYQNQEPPRDVRSLGEAVPQYMAEIADTAAIELKWGAVKTKITDSKQVADIIDTFESLQVTEYNSEIDDFNNGMNSPYACHVAFYKANGDLDHIVYWHGDYQYMDGPETGWFVMKPDIIRDMFQTYCMESRNALADTTFYADLDNDKVDEIIVVNPEDKRFFITIYEQDGYMLYDAWLPSDKYSYHGDYYLYENDGNTYLLEFDLDRLNDYDWNIQWYQYQFKKDGTMHLVDERIIDISRTKEDYRYGIYEVNLDELEAFFHELDEMLKNSMLLLSTENYQMIYSTVDHPITMTIDDYMDYWYDAMPLLAPIGNEHWTAMNMEERLGCVEYYLRVDSQMSFAKGWADTYKLNSGESRMELMSKELQSYVSKVDDTEQYEPWVPVYKKTDNHFFYYALRDDGVTVNGYEISQVLDAEGMVVENHYRIDYDLVDENGEPYEYTEEIEYAAGEDIWPTWYVAKCVSKGDDAV